MTCGGKLDAGWYRDKATLAAELATHGGQHKTAIAHGCSQSTLSVWAKKHGLPTDGPGSKQSGTGVPASLDDPVTETEILRQRVKDLEAAVTTVRHTDVTAERVLQRLEAAIPTAAPRYRPLPRKQRQARGDQHEFALLLSDLHAGEVVDPDSTLGMNQYNWATMLTRLARIHDAVLSFAEHRPYPITKLNVWMLGDMLSGDIHDELVATNEMPTAEATVQLAVDLSDWLHQFTEHFTAITVAGVPGNHPRATRKPQAKEPHNNADWLLYQMIQMRLASNPAFSFNFPRSSFAITMAADTWRVLLMHGDGIRSTMPGVPWGGVARRITTLQQQFQQAKQPIDYIALGHFHAANTLAGVGTRTIMNGSVKGLDEYSIKQFGSGHAPTQMLLTFHRRRGLTDQSWVDLEPVGPAGGLAVVAA